MPPGRSSRQNRSKHAVAFTLITPKVISTVIEIQGIQQTRSALEARKMWNHTVAFFKQMLHPAKGMVRDESGVTSIEYALLGFLIAVVAATGIQLLGGGVSGLWTLVSNAVVNAL